MKNMKKVIAVVVMAGILGTAGMAFAAENRTPAEIVSGITGESVEKVTEEREAGTRYGTQAADADKLEEFKASMLERRKTIFDQYVKDGKMTQAEADERLKAIEENMANCDGTGSGSMRGSCGGSGLGLGQGNGQGLGRGMRNGCGLGLGTGINNN